MGSEKERAKRARQEGYVEIGDDLEGREGSMRAVVPC